MLIWKKTLAPAIVNEPHHRANTVAPQAICTVGFVSKCLSVFLSVKTIASSIVPLIQTMTLGREKEMAWGKKRKEKKEKILHIKNTHQSRTFTSDSKLCNKIINIL